MKRLLVLSGIVFSLTLFPSIAFALDMQQALIRVQTLAVPCMKKAGFKLTPYSPSTILDDIGTKEFAKQWGFAISTTVERTDVLLPGKDPNVEYISKLSPDLRKKYAQIFKDCILTVIKDNPNDPAVVLLNSKLKEEEPPTLTVQQKAKLRRCISRIGFGQFEDKVALTEVFFEKAKKIIGYPPPVRWSEGTILVSSSSFSAPSLDEKQRTRLKELQADEREAALAVFACENAK